MPILLIACLGIVIVVASILWLRLHPIVGLVLGSLFILFLDPSTSELTLSGRLAQGMAEVFQKIGLPIVFASIVGACLLESGAATRIVQAIMSVFGAKRIAPALSVSGFIMAVPVYFDTVFYLLLPLAKAVARERPGSYLMSVMAIIVGATMAHSLVPPTPGPLLVASELGVPIGAMMIGGSIVGGFASAVGFAYGYWCSRTMTLEMPEEKQLGGTSMPNSAPPLWLAILPLAVPLAMIVLAETLIGGNSKERSVLWQCIGDPAFALLIAALIGMILLNRVQSRQASQSIVSRGVADAGVILLLTCAGGGFGIALKELGVGDAIVGLYPNLLSPTGLLLMAFGTTAIIRAAQGSATVAMTTTVGIVQPLLERVDLPFDPIYVALAIGCGSKPLPWMNDSGFWQVASMTGMSTTQTLKTFTVALTLMGFVGLIIVLTGAWLLPLK